MHAHAFLVLHAGGIALLPGHIASLAYKTRTIRLLLLSALAEDVAVLALVVRALLIPHGLIDGVPSVALAAWRRHHVLVLVEDLLVLVLEQSLSGRV